MVTIFITSVMLYLVSVPKEYICYKVEMTESELYKGLITLCFVSLAFLCFLAFALAFWMFAHIFTGVLDTKNAGKNVRKLTDA